MEDNRIFVIFQPSGKRGYVKKGTSIHEAARKLGIALKSYCGGKSRCGKCKVAVQEKKFGKLDAVEKLACTAKVETDSVITVPEESLKEKHVERKTIEHLFLKKPDAFSKKRAHGIAIDIGTTTVAGYLVSLHEGSIIKSASIINPQIKYGEDVMSRVTYAIKNSESALTDLIRHGINKLIDKLLSGAGIKRSDIKEVVVVGNTVMHHLFFGLDVAPLSSAPFITPFKDAVDTQAKRMSINLKNAALHALPIEESFAGADNVACILASEMHRREEISMLIDIGTNGEIVLGNKNKLLVTSCATGPAFEGAHIKYGMRAAPGAIEKVELKRSGEVTVKTINSAKPVGICGSGIVSAVSEMLRAGIIEKNGKFNERFIDRFKDRLRKSDDREKEFVLSWKEENGIKNDIAITQSDIRAVQLAKAAIYTGCRILMEKFQTEPERIHNVFIAGVFGNYLDKKACIDIGMLPEFELSKVENIGNAAGKGAIIALLDKKKREEAKEIAKNVKYISLIKEPGFENAFIKALGFP